MQKKINQTVFASRFPPPAMQIWGGTSKLTTREGSRENGQFNNARMSDCFNCYDLMYTGSIGIVGNVFVTILFYFCTKERIIEVIS